MKMCENDGFSKLHKKAKRSPGGRSALDPSIQTRKNAERLAVARESAHKPLQAVTCVKKWV